MLGKTLERIQKLRNKNAMWKQSHKGNTFFNAEKQLEDRPLKNVPAKILFRNIVDVVTAEERGADVLETCVCRKCEEELNCSKLHGINDNHQESICGACS